MAARRSCSSDRAPRGGRAPWRCDRCDRGDRCDRARRRRGRCDRGDRGARRGRGAWAVRGGSIGGLRGHGRLRRAAAGQRALHGGQGRVQRVHVALQVLDAAAQVRARGLVPAAGECGLQLAQAALHFGARALVLLVGAAHGHKEHHRRGQGQRRQQHGDDLHGRGAGGSRLAGRGQGRGRPQERPQQSRQEEEELPPHARPPSLQYQTANTRLKHSESAVSSVTLASKALSLPMMVMGSVQLPFSSTKGVSHGACVRYA